MSPFTPGYYITAGLRVKDPMRIDEARKALADLCSTTPQEPGCTIFQLHQDTATPTRFVLWERFNDETAFRQHFELPHTHDYLALDLTEVVQFFQTQVLPG